MISRRSPVSSPRSRFPQIARFGRALGVGLAAIALTLGSAARPAAADPFRPDNPRPIGDRAEAAFDSLFERGDYPETRRILERAIVEEPGEPLNHALMAAMAFLDEDWAQLDASAAQTQAAAEALLASDPLRGHLYSAVGHFLKGSSAWAKGGGGPLQGVPDALMALSSVYRELDAAEAVDANDPELRLIRGYMDLMLATYLPFASLDDAVAQLERARPVYLVDRGLALAYRARDRYDEALAAADRAIAATPDNPELWHLKAQILHQMGKRDGGNLDQLQESAALFERVLAVRDRLPEEVIDHLEDNELRRVKRDIERVQNGEPLE